MKRRGESWCSGRVNISCSACDTRHDVSYVVSLLYQLKLHLKGSNPNDDGIKIQINLYV